MTAWLDTVNALKAQALASTDPEEVERLCKELEQLDARKTAEYVRHMKAEREAV